MIPLKNRILKCASIIAVCALLSVSCSSCALKKENNSSEIEQDTVETNDSAVEFTPSSSSDMTAETTVSTLSENVLFITGEPEVDVYTEPYGAELVTTLKYGTQVEKLKSDPTGYYMLVKYSGGQGYVSKDRLTDTKESVTRGFTANIGENGAQVYAEKNGSGDILETLYPGSVVSVLAKTSGGYWYAATESGVFGYVSVTALQEDSIVENSVPDDIASSANSGGTSSAVSETFSSNNDDTAHDNTASATEETSSKSNVTSDHSVGSVSLESAVANAQSQVGGNWSAAYIDLVTGGSSEVNNSAMQSASLIKLFIMGAIYENYDVYATSEPNLDSWLYSMITVSDNTAANNLVAVLGNGDTDAGRNLVTSYCQNHGYYNTSMGRLLLESNINGDNYTSTVDCARFLAAAYNGEMPHSADMMSLLSQQAVTTKIPAGVPVRTANKTGELDSVQNDAAVVYADTPYVLCVMSENVPSGAAISAIVELSSSVYGSVAG